jgi:hypothetical protein
VGSDSRAHAASCSIGTGVRSPGVKRPWHHVEKGSPNVSWRSAKPVLVGRFGGRTCKSANVAAGRVILPGGSRVGDPSCAALIPM